MATTEATSELLQLRSDLAQLRERHEKVAARAHQADAELHDLKFRYKRLEDDRNALLARLRELEGGEQLTGSKRPRVPSRA